MRESLELLCTVQMESLDLQILMSFVWFIKCILPGRDLKNIFNSPSHCTLEFQKKSNERTSDNMSLSYGQIHLLKIYLSPCSFICCHSKFHQDSRPCSKVLLSCSSLVLNPLTLNSPS